mmetsp:Transcript_9064/g.19218  ORF Transcript_9064/g.19218 Transcript_9064/m.19218 type:complete len:200 (-) Transcript_9064:773-1372(-)
MYRSFSGPHTLESTDRGPLSPATKYSPRPNGDAGRSQLEDGNNSGLAYGPVRSVLSTATTPPPPPPPPVPEEEEVVVVVFVFTTANGFESLTPALSPGTAATLFKNCFPLVGTAPAFPTYCSIASSNSFGGSKKTTSPARGLNPGRSTDRVTNTTSPGYTAGTIDSVGTYANRTRRAKKEAVPRKVAQRARVPRAVPAS